MPLRRLLLSHAVQRAQAQHKIRAGDADHFAVRKELRQLVERHPVIRVVECGNQNEPICDVEVRVAGGKPLAVKKNWRRHRKRLHSQRVTVLVLHLAQEGKVFLQRSIVHIGGVFFAGDYHGLRIGEACQIVDMAVCVITRNSIPKPEGVAGSQIFGKDLLQILTI